MLCGDRINSSLSCRRMASSSGAAGYLAVDPGFALSKAAHEVLLLANQHSAWS
jgi:hypothetical protein